VLSLVAEARGFCCFKERRHTAAVSCGCLLGGNHRNHRIAENTREGQTVVYPWMLGGKSPPLWNIELKSRPSPSATPRRGKISVVS
jgi:hypothetical protein